MFRYEDELVIPQAAPILDYILSCHGNQQEDILGDRYVDPVVFWKIR